MYAWITPVSRPSALSSAGNSSGASARRIATILAKLITLPNNRTASAKVRDSSDMMLNGSMNAFGRT